MSSQPASNFERLCQDVKERGLFVGLATGSEVHQVRRPDGTVARWRDIAALEITDSTGHAIAAEAMNGIEDLERAASALL